MSRFAFALVLAASAAGAPATPPPPAPPAPPKDDWRAKFGLPEEIDPLAVSFGKPEMGATFARLDAAARKVAAADWQTRAGARYPYTFWNAGSDGFNQTYTGAWEKVATPARGPAVRPNHGVQLSTTLYTGKTARGFELRANWRPKSGWGAFVRYSLHESTPVPSESFELALWHDELRPAPADYPWLGLYFGPGRSQFSASRTDASCIYRFLVSAAPANPPRDRPPLTAEVAKYWSSAESLRDTALAELDALEANAKTAIAAGKAEITTKGGPTGADVPMPIPNATVPEAIRADVLKEALAEIANRKKLVREHFKDMHAAATAAFPKLDEALVPKK